MKTLTVTEITRVIKNLIEGTFNEVVSVEGEISNLSKSPSGHLYFTLKDSGAQIKVVFFKKYLSINRDYLPKNGDQVVVIGDLTVYEPDGVYQIVAKKIEYSSVGLFYKKFEETKRKLEAEGLFDNIRKKKIPLLIKKIAVLTSPSGAAIKDFMKILRDNDINVEIDIWPVQVQGFSAVEEIVRALKLAGKRKDYDLLILMRGGGSLEDLAIFNEESMARVFVDCSVPTLTAIGHERDFTIVDFVSDHRSPTPTAAAAFVVERFRQINDILLNAENVLLRIMENKIYRSSQRLDNLYVKLDKNSPLSKIKRVETFLRLYDETLKNKIYSKISEINSSLGYFYAILTKNNPKIKIESVKKEINFLEEKLKKDMIFRISASYDKLTSYESLLRNLDPENLLKKGYCIVFKDKKIVSNVKTVVLEDHLEIKMKNGYIHASVIAKKILEESSG